MQTNRIKVELSNNVQLKDCFPAQNRGINIRNGKKKEKKPEDLITLPHSFEVMPCNNKWVNEWNM